MRKKWLNGGRKASLPYEERVKQGAAQYFEGVGERILILKEIRGDGLMKINESF